MRRLCLLTVLALTVSPAVFAQSYRHGRVRHVEEGVSIQRATETGAEEATANLPFLPGDRVWTDGGGRAEFQFAGGSLLRLDSASKLDYVAHDDGQDERIVLRLWSGALLLHLRDRRDGPFEVETPGGVVTTGNRGVVRIDVQAGETRVSVYEGEASLDGAQPVRVRAGERLYARRGEVEEGPTQFDRTEGDEFAEWDDGRQEQTAQAANRQDALPEDVAPYADELDRHGAWYYESEVGHVWRPYVAAGWQPYSNGRWTWTVFGWTWVPSESWGWALSHYGRWGFAPVLGWYWIPGATWSPAWVSWAAGGDYVGWCPLGYRDRPVLVYDRFGRGNRGRAVPRGGTSVAETPWTYVRRGDVVRARSRPPARGARQQLRPAGAGPGIGAGAPDPRSRGGGGAAGRGGARGAPGHVLSPADVGHGAGDARRSHDDDPGRPPPRPTSRRPEDARARGVGGRSWGCAERGHASASRGARGNAAAATPLTPVPAARDPSDGRAQRPAARGGSRAETGGHRASSPQRRRGSAHARSPRARARERGASEAEREVLRPMFRALGRQRAEGRDAARATAAVKRRTAAGAPRRRPGRRARSGRGATAATGQGRRGASKRAPRAPPASEQRAPRQSNPPPRPEPQAGPAPPRGAAARRGRPPPQGIGPVAPPASLL